MNARIDPVTRTDKADNLLGAGSAPEPPSVVAALAVVTSLVESGVSDFAYCPGSRNAPFAYVLKQFEDQGLLRVHPFAEERGAAFWAIGMMKARPSAPVAVVTTSGTAVAELHPAMIEAHHQGLPLIALTADRPFEAHQVGANQTTNQVGVFANAPVAELSVPALSANEGADVIRKLTARVWRTVMLARGMPGLPGPAHINVALREPLVPNGSVKVPDILDLDARERANPIAVMNRSQTPWSAVVDPALRTLLVVGDANGAADESDVRIVSTYAAELAVPMLAEPSSGVTDLPNWIEHGPLVADHLTDSVEQLVVLGRPTLSRPLGRLLRAPNVRKIVVGNTADWSDEGGTASVYVDRLVPDEPDADASDGCSAGLGLRQVEHVRLQWLEFCRQLARDAENIVRQVTGSKDELNHLAAARAIWDASAGVALWLGASNAIRAFDLAAGNPGARFVYANRGLAGIDGTLASALGLQHGLGIPVRAVMGDLTFCYDLPSLAARPDGVQDIQIIVFDDLGGSIFSSLEHGKVADLATYDRFFRVRQAIDPCAVAEGCGWRALRLTNMSELESALKEPIVDRSLLQVQLPFPTEKIRQINEAAASL